MATSLTIQGAVLEESGRMLPYSNSRPLSISTLELDEPRAWEVLVRIEAASICHSDLSVVNGDRPRPLPMLLGHEAAGVVAQLGPEVEDMRVGDRVVLVFLPRCENCAGCQTDGRLPCVPGSRANNAGELVGGGRRLYRDGEPIAHHLGLSGFATHAVISRQSVVPVGNDVPANVAALMGCAMLTGGGALLNASAFQPGKDVIVVGAGGVGMAAILLARALGGGEVTAVDLLDVKREQARNVGASAALAPEEAVGLGLTAPIVIEAAGHPRAFETAVALTAPGGTTVTVGLPAPGSEATIDPLALTSQARTIIGSYMGSAVPARDIPMYAELWREGKLPLERLISNTIKLADINEAMDALTQGSVLRQVIRFGTDPSDQ